MAEIEKILARARAAHVKTSERYGPLAEVYNALQTCMAWDTIYEPSRHRVLTPVSRIWSSTPHGGGASLFCWDNYFGAWMAAIDHKDLAYSNAIELTREHTENGFVPNFATPTGVKSRDRSQPPVGSLTVRALYHRLLKEWLENGNVHENYCADTGAGCNRENSDRYYHWGALLGLIALMGNGYMEQPEKGTTW